MCRAGEFHGYEAHKRLTSEGVNIGLSRLYRVLNEMLGEGLLESRWDSSQRGPKIRLYHLGKKGKEELDKMLSDAIEDVHYFYDEYLLGLPPEVNAFNHVCRLLSSNLNGKGNIVFVTPQVREQHEKIIRGLHSVDPEAKIYLVKPESVAVDLKLDLSSLDGTSSSIPLKDGFADLLIVLSIPKKDLLETAFRELQRVLKQSGTLALIAPTASIKKYEDPLTMGDFLEKYEYETTGVDEQLDMEFIEASLKKFFRRCQEKHVVHMTILLAFEPSSNL
jgi:DNA-binding PadR family transcriptional regulator